MNVGENIRRIRKSRNLGQVALSERTGVTQAAISGIETGKRDPHQSTLAKLADALGVSIVDFYAEEPGLKGPPPPPRTPRTDEPEDAFVEGFERLGEEDAGTLRTELDGELTSLQTHAHRLRAFGIPDDHFAMRRARAKLARCVRRQRAATLLWTELGLGMARKSFEAYADPIGHWERWLDDPATEAS